VDAGAKNAGTENAGAQANGAGRLALPAVVDGDKLAGLRQALLTRLGAGEPARVDARAVCRISTQAVQILVAAAASFDQAGLAFAYLEPSDEFIEAFSDLGLYAHLGALVALED